MYRGEGKTCRKMEKQENQILYDWVSITSKIDSPQSLIWLLGLNREGVAWEQIKGMYGYQDRLYWNSISIHYNGREDMGVWLEMSGQGCRAFETFGSGDYEGLFRYVLENPDDVHITRLDVAFDDHTGILDMEQLKTDTSSDSYISKWAGGTVRAGHGAKRGQDTIEFGSMKSTIFLRIYNKAAERGFDASRHWLRVELQMRDERALAFLAQEENLGQVYRVVLGNYLRFIDRPAFGNDSNRRRWPTKPYWEQLLAGAGRISLYTKPGVEYNRMALQTFVYQQAGNAVAAEIICMGGPLEYWKKAGKTIEQLPLKYRSVIHQHVAMKSIGEDQKGK